MRLNPYEMGYFITQVGLSAASFGVTKEDVTQVGEALSKLFNHRCSPPTTIVKAQGEKLQSICTDPTCPLAENAMCGLYDEKIMDPANATSSSAASSASTSASSSTSKPTDHSTTTTASTTTTGASASPSPTTGAAAMLGTGIGVTLMGVGLGIAMFIV